MIMSRNIKDKHPVPGHSLTVQRRLLLELLEEAEGHIDAKELYRRASAKMESISPATVYRSLDLFKQLSLVSERRLGKLRCCYEVKRSSDHHHMVCQGCGEVLEFETQVVGQLAEAMLREHGFEVTELCVEGYCRDCSEKGKA
jgi:Fe2+ or Zn2+ uptake regulation protein